MAVGVHLLVFGQVGMTFCRVVVVEDEDTLLILVDRNEYKVRLEGIDAPE